MTFSATLVVGVISGIVTSAILYALASAFRQIVLPWYKGLIYTGIHVDGEWQTCEMTDKPSTIVQVLRMDLKQQAATVVGKATLVLDEESKWPVERIRTFDVKGNIENRFVQLNLTHSNKNRIGLQTMLLQVESDGRMMKGVSSFYNTGESVLASTNIAMARPDALEAINRYQKELGRKRKESMSR